MRWHLNQSHHNFPISVVGAFFSQGLPPRALSSFFFSADLADDNVDSAYGVVKSRARSPHRGSLVGAALAGVGREYAVVFTDFDR